MKNDPKKHLRHIMKITLYYTYYRDNYYIELYFTRIKFIENGYVRMSYVILVLL